MRPSQRRHDVTSLSFPFPALKLCCNFLASQANEASATLDALRQEATRERDRLQGAVEQGGQEAGREKERLRAEVEACRKQLDEKKKALDQEKVWAGGR